MKRILVADDERDLAESVKDMLSPYYVVDIATTAFDVAQLCSVNDYAGLIIDVEFGAGISGLEAASLVRESNRDIRILICSAVEHSDEVRQHAVDLGAVFGDKPLNLEFVCNVIEE